MSQKAELKQQLADTKFFSVLLDGSTDKANINYEVVFVIRCEHDETDEKTSTKMEYLLLYNHNQLQL